MPFFWWLTFHIETINPSSSINNNQFMFKVVSYTTPASHLFLQNYFKANSRHHIISLINVSLCVLN